MHALEQAPGLIVVLRGPDHIVEFVNAAHRAFFDSAGWVGRRAADIGPDEAEQGHVAALDGVFRTGEVRRVRAAPFARRDAACAIGPTAYFDYVFAPIRGEDGSVTGIFVEGVDVTERHRAQVALAERESKLTALNADLERQALERAQARGRTWTVTPDLMGALNADGYFETSNPAWMTVLGWTEAEVAAMPIWDLLHPDDLERTREGFRLTQVGEPAIGFPNRYRHKDGHYRWISWVGVPEGEYVYCVGRDITEEKAREVALAERTAERDRVWRASRDLYVTIGSDGRYRDANPAWESELGHSPASMIGRRFDDLAHPDDLPPTEAAWDRATAGDSLTDFEMRVRRADGSYRWHNWTVFVDGDIVVAYGRDIEERRRREAALAAAEEQLRLSQKLETIGQLTGGVAHDFNNLLMAVSSSLEVLRKRLPDGDDRARDLLDNALKGVERGTSLTRRMLSFARRQDLRASAVDVAALLEGMRDLLARSLGPQVALRIDAAEGVGPAQIDANQLEMAILNLAVNARDAMDGGGTIRIALDEAVPVGDDGDAGAAMEPQVRLRVLDDGHGMDAATLAQAMEPFFTTKGVGKGTGLGLSMIHGLARQSGGSFDLRSEPGSGTTAEFLLPRAPHAAIPDDGPDAPVDVSAGTQPLRVLAVDDDALILMGTAGLLEDLGHEVVTASSGQKALDIIASGQAFDVVLTDQAMPKTTGTQLAAEIRSILPDLPIILATGYAELPEGTDDLFAARLGKPFTQDEVAISLKRVATVRGYPRTGNVL